MRHSILVTPNHLHFNRDDAMLMTEAMMTTTSPHSRVGETPCLQNRQILNIQFLKLNEENLMTTHSSLPMDSPQSKLLREVYLRLFRTYGPQGWWPTTKEGCLHPTYQKEPHTLSEKERFEIIVGAILTQHTAWSNAEKAIIALNKSNLLNRKKLTQIEQDKLASIIRSAGYYRQKATRLKGLAAHLSQYPNFSEWFKKDTQELRQELLSLNGIGPETADSILLYTAKKPIFVIDAYTKRIFSRLGICSENVKYEELQQLFMSNLPHDVKLFNEYHALLVLLAKRHCKKNPLCKNNNLSVSNEQCPLLTICAHVQQVMHRDTCSRDDYSRDD